MEKKKKKERKMKKKKKLQFIVNTFYPERNYGLYALHVAVSLSGNAI